MRDVKRIDSFLNEIGEYWKKCPDWRFIQLITNVLSIADYDPWYMEEDKVLDLFNQFFKKS